MLLLPELRTLKTYHPRHVADSFSGKIHEGTVAPGSNVWDRINSRMW